MAYEKPLPHPTSDTKPFWDGCKAHQLRFQKCVQCHHVRWPPSMFCPVCHASQTEWIVACGKGTVYTFAVYHRAFHNAFEGDLPYVTAIVALEEGPHLLTNIIECHPDNLRCGMPVEVAWEDVSEEFSLPKFIPTL